MEDQKIVALFWERNENAIAKTKEKYGHYCYSVAYHILNNAEDAEECENDTYMNAWNSMPPHCPNCLQAFLGKLTRCISLKRWRDLRAQKRGGGEVALVMDELLECIPDSADVEAEVETKELAEAIEGFLKALSMVERHVFLCRYWYFDSIGEISRQFGFSESKVKSMLYRIRGKLLLKLKKEGFL
ncbi:MAG: sigma-70 family RNA polymerase sigma factor [Clostridia bacterium]|nr:sigma-70 family RNA polymerase sigma factor [Clostridia bacterium]